MRNLGIILLFGFFVITSCGDSKKDGTNHSSETNQTATVYQCPMDCEKGKTYEKPGQCPVCEMDLEKVTK